MTWHGYSFNRLFRAILTLALGVILCACGSHEDSPVPVGNHSAKLQAVRVVSLSPGLTATMVALGVSDRLVGRTPWCEVSTDVPIVGSLLDLNAEALVMVRPTVILLQPPAQGEIGGLSDLAAFRWGNRSTFSNYAKFCAVFHSCARTSTTRWRDDFRFDQVARSIDASVSSA